MAAPVISRSPAAGSTVVIVMGVSGCGKTTLAQRLAQRWCRPFIEGDLHHSADARARMAAGVPLDDDDRWPWLDRVAAAAASALAESGGAVVACSALKLAYRDRLRGRLGDPLFVCLDLDRERLIKRLARRTDHFMPAALIDSQLRTLEVPTAAENALVFTEGEMANVEVAVTAHLERTQEAAR